MFLSLALFNLDKFDEAEESYKKAIQDAPSQTLARQVSRPSRSDTTSTAQLTDKHTFAPTGVGYYVREASTMDRLRLVAARVDGPVRQSVR